MVIMLYCVVYTVTAVSGIWNRHLFVFSSINGTQRPLGIDRYFNIQSVELTLVQFGGMCFT